MNIGQVLEIHLGWAAKGLGYKIQEMLEQQKEVAELREFLGKIYNSSGKQEDGCRYLENLPPSLMPTSNFPGLRLEGVGVGGSPAKFASGKALHRVHPGVGMDLLSSVPDDAHMWPCLRTCKHTARVPCLLLPLQGFSATAGKGSNPNLPASLQTHRLCSLLYLPRASLQLLVKAQAWRCPPTPPPLQRTAMAQELSPLLLP
jgi:hypothetical protein